MGLEWEFRAGFERKCGCEGEIHNICRAIKVDGREDLEVALVVPTVAGAVA